MARRKQVEAPPRPEPVADPDDVRDRFPRGCWVCSTPIAPRQDHCKEHSRSPRKQKR